MNDSFDSPPPDRITSLPRVDLPELESVEGIQAQELMASRAEFHASTWSGPLPPPDVLRQYEALHPGATQLLFDQHREQVRHKIQMEQQAAQANRIALLRGQWMAYTLVLGALALSWVFTVSGSGAVAVSIVGLVIILPITHFAGTLITGHLRQARAKTTETAQASGDNS